MKKLVLLAAIFAFGLSYSACKKKGDDLALLLPIAAGSSNAQAPVGVPESDIKTTTPGSVDGGGDVKEITGDSATPPSDSGTSGSSGSGDSGTSGSSGSGTSGTSGSSGSGASGTSGSSGSSGSSDSGTSGSSGSGASGTSGSGNTNSEDKGDNKEDKGDNKDDGGSSKSGDSKDSKSKDGKDSKDSKSKDNKGKTNLVRLGKDICYAQEGSKWFKDAESVFTYQDNRAAGFCFKNVPAGTYEVRIMARHWMKSKGKKAGLPDSFKEYRVMTAGDGVAAEMKIPASDKGQEKGTATLDLTGGDIKILVAWTNGAKDVNFAIHQVKLTRTGDSNRSDLAGYLSGMGGNNLMLLIALLAVAVLGLFGISRLKKAGAAG